MSNFIAEHSFFHVVFATPKIRGRGPGLYSSYAVLARHCAQQRARVSRTRVFAFLPALPETCVPERSLLSFIEQAESKDLRLLSELPAWIASELAKMRPNPCNMLELRSF
jgi:hypothetical protein